MLVKLIEEMKELGDAIDELNEAKKGLQSRYDQLRLFDIPAAMAEAGDMRSTTGAFGRCTLQTDLGVKVLGSKQELHQWLIDGGNGALIVPTVNAQTLKAFVKEQMINGETIPETLIEAKPFSRAVLYKA